MARKKKALDDEQQRLDEVKRLVIIAMFSDDLLLERLVLKGGNALDLIHRISTRASLDLDFSMDGDFSTDEIEDIKSRLESSLKRTLGEANLVVFDIRMEAVPENITGSIADFWGGYTVTFKVIPQSVFDSLGGNLEDIRKQALTLGARGSTKFSIDISKHEYIQGKESKELEGYRVFVYSPAMVVCEKLRAICQQMPAYGPIVRRNRDGGARARDFVDIYTLVNKCNLDMISADNQELLRHVFHAKRVPLDLLDRIREYREFHREDFPSVQDTVKPGVTLRSFDFYFDFVLQLVSGLRNENKVR